MLTLQALDRAFHRFDLAADLARDLDAETGSLVPMWQPASGAEIVLRRLARHRTGRDDIAAAFGAEELGRLRPLLLAAGQAHGRVARSRSAS